MKCFLINIKQEIFIWSAKQYSYFSTFYLKEIEHFYFLEVQKCRLARLLNTKDQINMLQVKGTESICVKDTV